MRSSSFSLVLAIPALCVSILLSACDGKSNTHGDAQVDGGNLSPSRLFGGCVDDSQCPGVGAVCRKAVDGFPMGSCTRPCLDRTECDDGITYHWCLESQDQSSLCEERCRNGSDCSAGYSCDRADDAETGTCIPVCSTDAQCGPGVGGAPSVCNRYTGKCQAAGTISTEGAITGDACTSSADCRSERCGAETNNGTPTGYLGGYCRSSCVIPVGFNSSDFFSGDALPQGTCNDGDICLPAGAQNGQGDLGTCFKACTENTECRSGYECLRTIGSKRFENGICLPISCSDTKRCPSGYSCYQVGTSAEPRTVCGRSQS